MIKEFTQFFKRNFHEIFMKFLPIFSTFFSSTFLASLKGIFYPIFSWKITEKMTEKMTKKMSQKWPKTPIIAHFSLPNAKNPQNPSSISTPMIQSRSLKNAKNVHFFVSLFTKFSRLAKFLYLFTYKKKLWLGGESYKWAKNGLHRALFIGISPLHTRYGA